MIQRGEAQPAIQESLMLPLWSLSWKILNSIWVKIRMPQTTLTPTNFSPLTLLFPTRILSRLVSQIAQFIVDLQRLMIVTDLIPPL
jgi:hypothetical protein